MSQYRLLKFDVVHPQAYLERKHQEWDDIENLSLDAYRTRLNRLRSNYSDYYTYHLDDATWEAEEFYLLDPVFLNKVAQQLYGTALPAQRLKNYALRKLRPQKTWMRQVVRDYVAATAPDVVFVRSQPLASSFWQQFRDAALLVARLSARMPKNWHPEDFDLIYTDVPAFRDFFALHDVPSYLNDQGFDPRIPDELTPRPKQHDVVFVGGLGTHNFTQRTQLFEQIAANVPGFAWWGYWWPSWDDSTPTDDFPHLQRTFQGPTSGLEMFQIYRDSKICLNDYVDTADELGVNQRMYEVMGVGSFLLTRHARNLESDFPGTPFATYESTPECLEQIQYYLHHDHEREALAEAGQACVLKHYNYRDIVRRFGDTVQRHLEADRASDEA